MALATHTVSINPAFLQEIKDDHHELRQLMHHASAMFSRPEWMRTERDRLVQLLTKLRDQLAMHFSLEEAYGYFEDAVSAAPHLSRRAEALRAQHFTLYSDFCRLVDEAEARLYHESAPAPRRTCRRVPRLSGHLPRARSPRERADRGSLPGRPGHGRLTTAAVPP